MKRVTLITALILSLAGCSSLPLPATIDLKSHLGPDATGSFENELEAGSAETLDIRLPEENGEVIDFSDEEIFVTLEWARLHYDIHLDYEGPSLTGQLQAQLYAAPAGANDLWQEQYRLGQPITLNLDQDSEQLAGEVVLNADQIQAVNDKALRYGVWITGQDISAEESGTAVINYRVDELRLRIGFSVL